MNINVVTLFPEVFEPFVSTSLFAKARQQDALELSFFSLREFGLGKHRQVDDYPYGGGRGMVMKPEPFFSAVQEIKKRSGEKPWTILFTPTGEKITQEKLEEFACRNSLTLLCGHYEGVDARVGESLANEEVSVGDYILSGGESAAMVFLDGLVRLLPGVLAEEVKEEESFYGGLLEYPQYTRPVEWEGHRVPEVLLSGNHQEIKKWRQRKAEMRTRTIRPDLLAKSAHRTALFKEESYGSK